jgi:hypothetical protein
MAFAQGFTQRRGFDLDDGEILAHIAGENRGGRFGSAADDRTSLRERILSGSVFAGDEGVFRPHCHDGKRADKLFDALEIEHLLEPWSSV